MRAVEYLMSGDIAVDAIQSDIGWYHFQEVSHERDKCLIIVGLKTSLLPYLCEFTLISHDHWVDFEFVRAVERIPEYLTHRFTIHIRIGT